MEVPATIHQPTPGELTVHLRTKTVTMKYMAKTFHVIINTYILVIYNTDHTIPMDKKGNM